MTLEKIFILTHVPEKTIIRDMDQMGGDDDKWSKQAHAVSTASMIDSASTTVHSACNTQEWMVDSSICGLFSVCASLMFVAP